MGIAFFERVIELQKKHARPGLTIQNALQTNATTLDSSWCQFLKRHDFLVGVFERWLECDDVGDVFVQMIENAFALTWIYAGGGARKIES
jgi:sulfatase maturation enzyme AslB (radical SAM superfamily)